MKTWGLETEIAILLFLITLPLIIAPLVYGHFRRFGRWQGWPAVVMLGTVFYGCGLVAFTMFPLPTITADFCEKHESLRHWNWTPFRFVPELMNLVNSKGLAGALMSTLFLAEVFNIVMTIPLGFILVYRFRFSVGKGILAGFLVSLTIEMTQHTGIWGVYPCPYRFSEVDDLIMNTLGAFIGGVLAWKWGRFLPDVHPRPDQSPVRPTVRRRAVAGALDVVVLTLLAALAELVVAVAYQRSGGEFDNNLPDWFLVIEKVVGVVISPLALFLLVPLLRKDGATIGQVCLLLRPVNLEGEWLKKAGVLKKFVGRWGCWMLLALFGPMGAAFPLLILLELGAVWIRADKRSLSSVFAALETRDSREKPKQERFSDPKAVES